MMDYAKAYRQLHKKRKYFQGNSIRPYVDDIAALVKASNARRLVDYGCGKGLQYTRDNVHEAWGGIMPYLYDPGVPELDEYPLPGYWEGVICTDVMEHIDKPDVDDVLGAIFRLTAPTAFVFFSIACRPAKRKRLPDGRNVHLTVKPPEWWIERLRRFERPGLQIEYRFDNG